jgi:hypothetical protein
MRESAVLDQKLERVWTSTTWKSVVAATSLTTSRKAVSTCSGNNKQDKKTLRKSHPLTNSQKKKKEKALPKSEDAVCRASLLQSCGRNTSSSHIQCGPQVENSRRLNIGPATGISDTCSSGQCSLPSRQSSSDGPGAMHCVKRKRDPVAASDRVNMSCGDVDEVSIDSAPELEWNFE